VAFAKPYLIKRITRIILVSVHTDIEVIKVFEIFPQYQNQNRGEGK
jgi:hypothetical protein